MKNILIIGPSRVGKSNLCSMILKKYYNLNYISGDSIRNAFINIYPDLGYTTKNTINRIEFCKFINWIINENNIHIKRNLYYVIDSADISLDHAMKVFDDTILVAIGRKDTTVEKMVHSIKENDTELDWTYGYSDEDLSSISSETIKKSKQLYNECLSHNIAYFDTSIDRYSTYKEIFKYIEKEIGK